MYDEQVLNAICDMKYCSDVYGKEILDDYPDIQHFVVGGGVSANSRLREKVQELAKEYPNVTFTVPPMSCCTDNATMIALAGTIAYEHGRVGDDSLTADSNWEIQ